MAQEGNRADPYFPAQPNACIGGGTGTRGYLCSGENSSRYALRSGSLQRARGSWQAMQAKLPGVPQAVVASAIEYVEPQLSHLTDVIFIAITPSESR